MDCKNVYTIDPRKEELREKDEQIERYQTYQSLQDKLIKIKDDKIADLTAQHRSEIKNLKLQKFLSQVPENPKDFNSFLFDSTPMRNYFLSLPHNNDIPKNSVLIFENFVGVELTNVGTFFSNQINIEDIKEHGNVIFLTEQMSQSSMIEYGLLLWEIDEGKLLIYKPFLKKENTREAEYFISNYRKIFDELVVVLDAPKINIDKIVLMNEENCKEGQSAIYCVFVVKLHLSKLEDNPTLSDFEENFDESKKIILHQIYSQTQ